MFLAKLRRSETSSSYHGLLKALQLASMHYIKIKARSRGTFTAVLLLLHLEMFTLHATTIFLLCLLVSQYFSVLSNRMKHVPPHPP